MYSIKYLFLYVACVLFLSACRLPAYLVNEYLQLPEGLNKKEFKALVAERNERISSARGFVKIYDLVKIPARVKRDKLFLERELFENSYALPKDSLLISTHLNQLISISHRLVVWPSVYPKVYNDILNPNYWTVWMSHEKQKIIRDSIDQATLPILAVSKYRMEPGTYLVYKEAMRIKKIKLMRK
jgi:hypothetical protein